jgi:hypothetical protein
MAAAKHRPFLSAPRAVVLLLFFSLTGAHHIAKQI